MGRREMILHMKAAQQAELVELWGTLLFGTIHDSQHEAFSRDAIMGSERSA